MKYFYKNLVTGLSKDVSLRNAKIEYLKSAHPQKKHPYYWAGFIIIGDCSPLWSSKSILNWFIIGFLCVIVLLFLLKK